MAQQPFDFNALLSNPAFAFGAQLLTSARQPNAVGNAFGTVQKLGEMKQQQQYQQQQIQMRKEEQAQMIAHQQQQEAVSEQRAQIAQQQFERQQAVSEHSMRQQDAQAEMQQKMMDAAQGMGLFGPSSGMTPPQQPGMEGGDVPPGLPPPMQQPQAQMPQMQPMQDSGGAGRHGTPNNILTNLMQAESSGNPNAVGPVIEGAGDRAMGGFQFRKGTIDMLKQQGYPNFNPFDMDQSRDAADFYLSSLQKKHGDLPKALAAYGGFVTKDPSNYINKVMNGKARPSANNALQAAGSIQPPTTTPAQPGVGARSIDVGRLGLMASMAGIKGGAQIMDMAKLLEPQSVSANSYQRDPATGKMTFVGSPYEERRLQNDDRRMDNEDTRVEMDAKRLQHDAARLQNENIRTGFEGKRVQQETAKAETAATASKLTMTKERLGDKAAVTGINDSMDRLAKNTTELMKHPGLSVNTGLTGMAGMWRLTENGRNAGVMMDSLKSKLVVDTLKDLKSSSANGSSGFGALSDKEGKILENLVANLDRSQSQESMQKALKDITDFTQNAKMRAGAKYTEMYGAEQPAPAAGAPAAPAGGAMSLQDYIKKHKK